MLPQPSYRRTFIVTLMFVLAASPTAARASGSVIVFENDFEICDTNGWSKTHTAEVSEGYWRCGTPNATFSGGVPAQPGVCAEGSTKCAFTGQNPPTGEASQGDVDFGTVYLTSPPINLAGAQTAELSYSRWYYLRDLNEDPGDYFAVQARPDGGSPWVTIEFLDNSQPHNTWTYVSWSLDQPMLTETVQIRFVASDGTGPMDVAGNIVEAAVDNVRITATFDCDVEDEEACGPAAYCNPAGQCVPYGNGDLDGDGDVDLADCARFQACFGMPAEGPCEPAKMTGSGTIDHEDAALFITNLTGPG